MSSNGLRVCRLSCGQDQWWGVEPRRLGCHCKAFSCSPRVVRPGRTVWRPRRTGPSETSVGGGMCLLVLHLQWYICPLLVIRQGLNRALLASEVAPEEVRRTAKPATTQYSLPLTASASSRRKTNICVRNFLLVVIWAQHRSLVLSKFSTILRF